MPACYFSGDGDPALGENWEGVGKEVREPLGGEEIGMEEVAAVSVEEKEWQARWLESAWYGEVVRYLLEGALDGEDLTARGRRLLRLKAARFRMYDRKEKALFYVESDGV